MLKWLNAWLKKQQERKQQRLIEEGVRLRTQLRELDIDIVLTPEQKARLRKKAAGIDPEVLKKISLLDLTDDEQTSND